MRPQQFIGIKSVLVKSIETSTIYERQEYKEDVVKVKSFDKMSPNWLKRSLTEIWSLENVIFLSREPGKYFDICQD